MSIKCWKITTTSRTCNIVITVIIIILECELGPTFDMGSMDLYGDPDLKS